MQTRAEAAVKAVQHAVHGGPEVMELVDVADPEPGPRDVVVEVRCAAVNRLDLLQREGPALLPNFHLPHIPGMDIAGVVVARGTEVDTPALGDRVVVKAGIHCGTCPACRRGDDRRCAHVQVIGGNRPGGYAERCVVPASHAFPLPEHVGFDQAATIPTTLSTAWRALFDTGRVQAGETVVIHGPSSGVSVVGIQLAKHAGATVIVTGRSEEKLERVRKLGADHVLREDDPRIVDDVWTLTDGRGADVVLNHVGPALFPLSVALLGMDGRLVHCGTTTGAQVALNLPQLYHMGIQVLGAGPQSYAGFAGMLQHYWAGSYDAVVDSRFPLVDAAAAQERLASGQAFGKVLLCP